MLVREQKNLAETAGLCHLILEEDCLYQTLSPDQYLERMVEMEEKGTKFKNMSNDTIRKKRGSIIATVVFILIMFSFVGILIWGYTQDPISNLLFGLFLLVPIVFVLAVTIALQTSLFESPNLSRILAGHNGTHRNHDKGNSQCYSFCISKQKCGLFRLYKK